MCGMCVDMEGGVADRIKCRRSSTDRDLKCMFGMYVSMYVCMYVFVRLGRFAFLYLKSSSS